MTDDLQGIDLAEPIVLVATAIGYLLGSIPFGLLFTRLAGFGDIRAIGSGNIGATNVLRTGNKALAAATLLCDLLKGTAAVLLGGAIGGPGAAILGGLGAFVGHLFPVWLAFRGGKGVATFIGITLGLVWQAVPIFALTWLGVAALTRYSSLGALVASIVTTASVFFFAPLSTGLIFVAMTILLWLRHGENLRRLAAGSESRIGRKA